MAWNVDDIPIFIAIVEQEGITAAANHLQMPKSTVSKALTRLEQDLGLRLIERNSRRVRVTADGETFYRHSLLIMEQVREASAVMGGLRAKPAGRLVVALPMAFSREIVAPQLHCFQADYPEVDLELLVTSHPVDIIRDHIDLAVVVGAQPDSDLIVKTILQSELIWVVGADYAETHNLGQEPDDLQAHLRICEKRYGESKFPITWGGQHGAMDLKRGLTHVNDPITVREAVINGCGVSLVPSQYCRRDLESGRLRRVFDHIRIDRRASALSVTYPSRSLLPTKSRAFLDFLDRLCQGL